MLKSGTVAICGKPNVGKSTLINALAKSEVAITSFRPQTTRNLIRYLYQDKNLCVAFFDTPGYCFSHNKLDEFENEQIKKALKHASIILYMIDASKPLNNEDLAIIKQIKNYADKQVIVCINKIDLVNDIAKNKLSHQLHEYLPSAKYLYISAKQHTNIDDLLKIIDDNLPAQAITDQQIIDNDQFLISEIIRQQIIINFYQEIPYATAVNIKHHKYDKQSRTYEIFADIIVEKASQKPIIIGKNGQMLKKIRINAIKKLKTIYDCSIILHLYVVVYDDWRNNEKYLKEIGYQ